MVAAWEDYQGAAAELLAASRMVDASDRDDILRQDVTPLFTQLVDELEEWSSLHQASAADAVAAAREAIDQGILGVGATVVLILAVVVVGSRFAQLSVRRAIDATLTSLDSSLILNRFTELSTITDDEEELARLALGSVASLADAPTGVLHLANHSGDRAEPAVSIGGAPEDVAPAG